MESIETIYEEGPYVALQLVVRLDFLHYIA